jgi:hypothetical protein
MAELGSKVEDHGSLEAVAGCGLARRSVGWVEELRDSGE